MPCLDSHDELLRDARRLGYLANVAYIEDSVPLGIALADQFPRVEVLPLGLGFVAGNDNEVVAAFAGSRDGIDWVFNLTPQLVPGYGGRVHKGFAHLADHIGDEVERAVRQLRTGTQTLSLTGHSRGGALAALMAQRLHAQGIEPARVITFGTPRTGDGAFARAYRVPHFRFEAAADPVPCLPPFPDYQAVGQRLVLTGDRHESQADGHWTDSLLFLGQLLRGRDERARAVASHAMSHYLAWLNRG